MTEPQAWDAIDGEKFADEDACIAGLLARVTLAADRREAVIADAIDLVRRARRSARWQGVVEGFLQEFALGTQEGTALMCLAEALLRIPDAETRDSLIAGLAGALETRVLGDPALAETDIGPVIDAEAQAALEAHVARLEREGAILARHRGTSAKGHYFAPVIAEIPAPDYLEREVFGPILHVYRYGPGELREAATRFAARGYGLTLGIHTRLERFARTVQECVPAGNVYINRSIIGAVVGVQPFGGVGLSGTGPKAGGPDVLLRYAVEQAIARNIMAEGGDPELLGMT